MISEIFIILLNGLYVAAKSDLVFANVLFRHGARAPTVSLSSRTKSSEFIFNRGLGELTRKGIESTLSMGRSLGERYVDSGFLKKQMIPSEVYFRSRALNRCLQSAALIGTGMWEKYEPKVSVPVYSQERGELLLNYPVEKCPFETERIQKFCPEMSHKGVIHGFENWPQFEQFVYECLGTTNFSKAFNNSSSMFSKIESLINEEKNGIKMPKEYHAIREEIYREHNKVTRFIIGAGEYHDVPLLRLKGGHIVHTILSNLRIKWNCHKGKFCPKIWRNRKFVAYSSQDWLVAVVLEIFGLTEKTIADELPEYNAILFFELWDNNGNPEVKIFYQRSSAQFSPVEVTSSAKGCSAVEGSCPLEGILSCCDKYTNQKPREICEKRSITA